MTQDIHFEIFRRHGAKGGWSLHDVTSSRDIALSTAAALMAEEKATGVKVVKETYNSDTGDYLSLKIFEDGHNKVKVEPAAEDVPHALPCFKPDDFYSYHARSTMARLLADFLVRQRLTVTELIHRADALEKLEATGTLYQHAVQKIAVAQAASTKKSVQQIVKDLNELATKAIHRVYRDARKNYFPKTGEAEFGELATKLEGQSDAAYVLNGAIVQYLSDTGGWDEKLARILRLMERLPGAEKPRARLLSSIDAIVAEILSGSAALHELIGQKENLGEALLALVWLFLGQDGGPQAGMPTGIESLAGRFANDELPDARMAVANRILAELKGAKRLSHGSLTDELKMLRKIANNLVLAQGKYLEHEDIIAAFTLRSKRLITHEAIANHLDGAAGPDEKLERLLVVEENIIGQENKRNLGAFVLPIVSSAAFETHFTVARTPPLERIQTLAGLQSRVRRSAFQDIQRRDICDVLDSIACQIESHAKLLDSIEAKAVSNIDRVHTLLKLCSTGVLTEGELARKARERILRCLGEPGFLTGYAARLSREANEPAPDAKAAVTTLMHRLENAGIPAESGLKSIVA